MLHAIAYIIHNLIFLMGNFLKFCLLSLVQIPFSVVVAWIMGRPMDLNFQLFETATLFITVLVVAFMLQVCVLMKSRNKSM